MPSVRKIRPHSTFRFENTSSYKPTEHKQRRKRKDVWFISADGAKTLSDSKLVKNYTVTDFVCAWYPIYYNNEVTGISVCCI